MEEEFDFGGIVGADDEFAIQKLGLFIPNKYRVGNEVQNHKDWVNEALKLLSIFGGGATAMPPADGRWLDPDKGITRYEDLKDEHLVSELSTFVYVYFQSDMLSKNINHLKDFIQKFGKETNQGQVALEFDNTLFMVNF